MQIKQIIVEHEGHLCGVLLSQEQRELMDLYLRAATNSTMRLYKLPDSVREVSLKELEG